MKSFLNLILVVLFACELSASKKIVVSDDNLKNELKKVFSDCKHEEKDFDQKLQKAKDISENWAEKLNNDEIKKRIYETSFGGQVLTVLAPNSLPESNTLAELAKSCWVEYEDWRRTYSDTKNKKQEISDYETWQKCVKGIYKEKIEVMSLIDACRPKIK